MFLGMFQLLEKLIEIFKDLIVDAKAEIKHHLIDMEDEREIFIETKWREKEFDNVFDEFKKIYENTSNIFIKKFEKNIKWIESWISSSNIFEII